MRKSLTPLAVAALLTALGACNRQQPDRAAPEGERELDKAVSNFRDASSDMRNDAANVPGAVPDRAVANESAK